MFQVKIEKLVFGGQGMGHYEGKTIFVWGALPGEVVKVEVIKKKKDHIIGRAVEIIEPSPDRIKSREEHHLSCSPWQIMSFDKENEWKGKIAAEQFRRFAQIDLPNVNVISDDRQYHYRNKMEYSFWEDEGKWSLAFFKRGEKYKLPIDECCLATKEINIAARAILNWINGLGVTQRVLKSLVLRSAGSKVVAGLFVTDEDFFPSQAGRESLQGFQIFYSDRRSPASRPDKLLYSDGLPVLFEKINHITLHYGTLSFFQINVSLFEQVLASISKYINQDTVVDFYSGVGAISIALSDQIKKAILVESDAEAVKFAERNVELNKLHGFTVVGGQAEKLIEEIKPDRLIIVDPPRAGLHQKIIKRILAVRPPRIIYLSCNLATQARDVAFLSEQYQLTFNQLYNFFPRTPHMESLCVLDVK